MILGTIELQVFKLNILISYLYMATLFKEYAVVHGTTVSRILEENRGFYIPFKEIPRKWSCFFVVTPSGEPRGKYSRGVAARGYRQSARDEWQMHRGLCNPPALAG